MGLVHFTGLSSIETVHSILTALMFVSGVSALFTLLLGPTAPYGRYSRQGWGFMVNVKLAWFTQEVPSLLIPLSFFIAGALDENKANFLSTRTLLTAVFLVHYTYRSLVYPLLQRGTKPTPFGVWLMSFVFCCWNGFLQGYSLMSSSSRHGPLTALGLLVWLFGFLRVVEADSILRNLRKPGETGYKVPTGGLFQYVSAANYTAEIIEWTGFALACQSPASGAFAFFTFCNLFPRALAHHRWYLEKFEDYPASRKAVIPWLV